MAPALLEWLICIDTIGEGRCNLSHAKSVFNQEKHSIVESTYADGLQPVEFSNKTASS